MTNDTLDKALAYTLAEEGGWSNHPKDKGGATNFGITFGVFKGLGRAADLDGDGQITPEDLRLLDREKAKEIYRQLYWPWDKHEVARVDPRILIKVFDIGVNCGPRMAAILLQRAINKTRGNFIAEDGVIGPKTITGILGCQPNALLFSLCEVQLGFYNAIVIRDPSQQVFINGWKKRAMRIPNAV